MHSWACICGGFSTIRYCQLFTNLRIQQEQCLSVVSFPYGDGNKSKSFLRRILMNDFYARVQKTIFLDARLFDSTSAEMLDH
mgnify:CR=1 FL=1